MMVFLKEVEVMVFLKEIKINIWIIF